MVLLQVLECVAAVFCVFVLDEFADGEIVLVRKMHVAHVFVLWVLDAFAELFVVCCRRDGFDADVLCV